MAKKPGTSPSAMKSRAAKTAAALSAAKPSGGAATATGAPATPKKKTDPLQFLREVRAEARKITWTSRKETWITSVMVLIMVTITAIFFLIVDWILGAAVAQLLQFATAG
jgi:preprotein translocase subunit SecE